MERIAAELQECELCPRRCRARRAAGNGGYCRSGADLQIYRYGPHFGEEPPVSGTHGSGTVFFSRCTMRCLYCQNYRWSQQGAGSVYSLEALADLLRQLRKAGCHNWNFVSPTPWLPWITAAVDMLAQEGETLPVVYNTSGYERVETLAKLNGKVDVYLADLRYADDATAQAASDAPGYVATARAALLEMWRQTGRLRLNSAGIAEKGLICRILVLPGHAHEACANLVWLVENIGPDVAVSVMSQYWPAYQAPQYAQWNRVVTREEYAQVCAMVEKCGFTTAWLQEYDEKPPDDLLGFNMPPGAAV